MGSLEKTSQCYRNPLLRTTEIPNIRYCVPLNSEYPLLRTTEILISVTAYHWNPNIRYCVPLKSLYPLLRTTEIRFKFLYPLLRTTEIPISVTACNWHPDMCYCVPLKSLSALNQFGYATSRCEKHAGLQSTLEVTSSCFPDSFFPFNFAPYLKICAACMLQLALIEWSFQILCGFRWTENLRGARSCPFVY